MTSVNKSIITNIRKIVSLCFLLGILLSFNLWHSDRQFPLVPIFNPLTELSTSINYVILGLLITLLTAIFFSSNRKFTLTFLILLSFSIIQDQTRLQPWVYIYILMLLPYLLQNKPESNQKKNNYLQLLFIGIYIWSGIHKLNPNFVEVTFRSMMLFLFKINNASISDTILSLGYSIPIIEIGIGISLIYRKTRRLGVVLALISHIVIIIFISSTGELTNSVVYPWNIAMILCVYLLFYKRQNKITILKESSVLFKFLNVFIFGVVFLLPSLNLIAKWDTYLSFSFYSSKIKNYYILIEDTNTSANETEPYKEYFRNIDGISGGKILDLNLWSYKELNIPLYPEKRIFNKIATTHCEDNFNSSNLIFIEFDLPLWDIFIYKPTENPISKIEFLNFKQPLNLSNNTYTVCSKSPSSN